ncbi:hypothetical protein K9F07_12660 [Staphylococcus pseudintermedius]|nr:hypothetical protein K9F07_12660 [Staphylococcus pseudintermedius]
MCQVLGVSRSGDDDWKNRKPSARTVKREAFEEARYKVYHKKKYKATTH